ncbi:MAG: tail fiber domain-containing protein [Bdellovibrionales bacterium]|nr:tail fiber domain-containing protein [Bdellovibrionales bacterium]
MKQKFILRIYRNQGSMLVQMMVGAGLIATVSLGMSSVFTNMFLNNNLVKAKNETESFHEELRAHLSNRQACINTFSGLGRYTNGVEYNLTKIANAEVIKFTTKFDTNHKYGGDVFRIKKMKVVYNDLPAPAGSGEAVLSVQYSPTVKTNVENFSTREITVAVTKDTTTNNMIDCVSKAKMTDGIWRRSLSNINDIYFTNGNVGVGTGSPSMLMEVSGAGANAGAKFTRSAKSVWIDPNEGDGNTTSQIATSQNMGFLFTVNGTVPTRVEALSIKSDGKVGIGTTSPSMLMEVSGVGASAGAKFTRSAKSVWIDPNEGDGNTTSQIATSQNMGLLFSVNGTAPTRVDALSIRSDGRVGIGTTAPRTALDIPNGRISAWFPGTVATTGNVCYNGVTGIVDACTSLKKFKDKITPLNIGLKELNQLRPVSYVWKSTGEKDVGFIAEEVVKVDERLGLKSTERKLVGVKYDKMAALLTKSVQELAVENEDLKRKYNVLLERLEKLEKSLIDKKEGH